MLYNGVLANGDNDICLHVINNFVDGLSITFLRKVHIHFKDIFHPHASVQCIHGSQRRAFNCTINYFYHMSGTINSFLCHVVSAGSPVITTLQLQTSVNRENIRNLIIVGMVEIKSNTREVI